MLVRRYTGIREESIKNFLSGLNCFRDPWRMLEFICPWFAVLQKNIAKGQAV